MFSDTRRATQRNPCHRSSERIGSRAIVSFCDSPPLLRLAGDEDATTQGIRRTALSRALRVRTDLEVDLTDLAFADPSLMLDLAMIARRLRKKGRRMIVRGAQPQIQRLIELVGLHHLPSVVVIAA